MGCNNSLEEASGGRERAINLPPGVNENVLSQALQAELKKR